MRTKIQKFGKTLMGPLSIIVASGLLLGIVSILQNPSIFGESIQNGGFLAAIITGVNSIVGMMFSLLPILFAVSVAIGLANEDKEYAAFAVVIAFFIFHITLNHILTIKGINAENMSVESLLKDGLSKVKAFEKANQYDVLFGIFTYRMGIFGGILVGLWTALIHNKFHTQELPIAFSFFAGNRFVPIMTVITVPFLAIVMYFIWPYFSGLINAIGKLISNAGIFGPFIYGFSERLLIPTGLHHILNQLIRFTPIGGVAEVGGKTYTGALTIFQAALAAPNRDINVLRYSTRFLTQGTHPFMVFGLPGACLAMYKTSFLENRNKVKALLSAAALTSFFTGITEPIEFAFIFISPILWIFHAFMAGLSFFLMSLMKVAVGNAGGGFIDLAIFGIFQGTYTRWFLIIPVGIIYFITYYYVFKKVILKYNLKTPGRDYVEEVDIDENENKNANINYDGVGQKILKAVGGKDNIKSIDNCISRLRLVLNDTGLVDDKVLKNETGAMGIIKIDGENIQIVYGTKVEKMARELKRAVKES